jgi:hypothetical protein
LKNKLFHDVKSLKNSFGDGTFDVVVMCNVLHEVPPSEWSRLFGKRGTISRLLRNTGFLLVVEVQQLPYGERAHDQGFLVLDTSQFRKLFNIGERDLGFSLASARNGWLKAHHIAKNLLEGYSDRNRTAALKDLSETAKEEIRKIRAATGYRAGRLHGFWLQQFANAELALG